jgi:hypothetical protein
MLLPGFLLGFLFDPDDRGDILLRNVNWLSPKYTALCTSDHVASLRVYRKPLIKHGTQTLCCLQVSSQHLLRTAISCRFYATVFFFLMTRSEFFPALWQPVLFWFSSADRQIALYSLCSMQVSLSCLFYLFVRNVFMMNTSTESALVLPFLQTPCIICRSAEWAWNRVLSLVCLFAKQQWF